MIRNKATIGILLALALCHPQFAAAQKKDDSPTSLADMVQSGGVDVQADELEYESDRRVMTGRGHVVIKHGVDTLTADFVTVDTVTQDATARGNVVIQREGTVWRGEEAKYNFKTRTGNFGGFDADMPPFHIKAKESQRTANGSFVLRNAKITTCDGDRPEFYMKAREVRITKNNRFRAKGVVFYLGPVPILYMPYVLKGLGEERTDIDLVPGYNSRLGAYLLTAYNYRINGGMTAATRLDYYGSRGPAVGQDFNWGDPRLTYRGGFKAYYINDGSPMKGRTDDEVMELQCSGQAPDARDFAPELSAPYVALLEKLLARNSAHRPRNWHAALQDMRQVRRGQFPVGEGPPAGGSTMHRHKPAARRCADEPAPAPTVPPPGDRWRRRVMDPAALPRWIILLLALAAFLAGFAIVLAVLRHVR